MPDTLYYYCTLSTFVKIIESKTLRLSEIGKSNDYMELVWLRSRIIPEIIRQRFSEIYNGFPTTFQLEIKMLILHLTGQKVLLKCLSGLGIEKAKIKYSSLLLWHVVFQNTETCSVNGEVMQIMHKGYQWG